ncbi:MAG: hypothetical protein MJZ81_05270 [Bacteroidales bacterium]|nr:hypothetical protein [Bacteroidales bacterium]
MEGNELIQACKTSNEAIMVLIFDNLRPILLSIGKQWFSGCDDSMVMWQDYFQEIAMKVYQGKFSNMSKNANPRAYVVRALKNTASDVYGTITNSKRLRGADGTRSYTQLSTPISLMVNDNLSEDDILSRLETFEDPNHMNLAEMEQTVNRALKPFGSANALIFHLHVDGHKTSEIIAELQGCSGTSALALTEGAVRARIARMTKQVRKALENEGLAA